jgi:hypothetical protein
MALLSQLIRQAAITGRPDTVNAWFADRQGAQWTERTIRAAFPPARHRPPAEMLRELEQLHERGVVTDAEFDRLRAGLPD